jgi:hypothetical protein
MRVALGPSLCAQLHHERVLDYWRALLASYSSVQRGRAAPLTSAYARVETEADLARVRHVGRLFRAPSPLLALVCRSLLCDAARSCAAAPCRARVRGV